MAFDYNKLMANPLFQTGLGIMGQSGPGNANLMQRLSRGALGGLQSTLAVRQAERQRLKDELVMEKARREREREDRLQKLVQPPGRVTGPVPDFGQPVPDTRYQDLQGEGFLAEAEYFKPDEVEAPKYSIVKVKEDDKEVAYLAKNGIPYERFAEGQGGGQTINVGGDPAPFTKKLDEAYAPQYLEWQTTGRATHERNLGQLDFALDQLNKSGALSGPLVGAIPEPLRKFVSPGSVATQEAAQEVAQQSLKKILGAQFGEKEGQRLIDKAYNPALPEKENIRRIKLTIDFAKKVSNNQAAMAKYVEEHQTLLGFKGEIPTVEQLEAQLDAGAAIPDTVPGVSLPPGWTVTEVPN